VATLTEGVCDSKLDQTPFFLPPPPCAPPPPPRGGAWDDSSPNSCTSAMHHTPAYLANLPVDGSQAAPAIVTSPFLDLAPFVR